MFIEASGVALSNEWTYGFRGNQVVCVEMFKIRNKGDFNIWICIGMDFIIDIMENLTM